MLWFIQALLGAAAVEITRVTFLPLYGASVWILGPLGRAVGFQTESMTSVYGDVRPID
jgi:hypothetical protein